MLGEDDYGIYNVVGGLVVMLGFLNGALSGATQRFLSFEIQRGDVQRLQRVFSTSLMGYGAMALLVVVLGESIGLWFLNNVMVIPPERLADANVIYQLSILSFVVSTISIPYHSLIISHERMNIFALVSVVEVALKLGLVLLITLYEGDRLVLYAGGMFLSLFLAQGLYVAYSRREFAEARLRFDMERSLVREMSSFIGWDVVGNISVLGRVQGVNILLNLFFGPVVNAANGVAVQVQSAVMAFGSNVVTAIKPQVVKCYSAENYSEMYKLINHGAKYAYLLMWAISLPLLVEMPLVLRLWLSDSVPAYTDIFAQLTLVFNLFAVVSMVVVSGLHALGKVKRPSLINGTLYLMVLPLSYLAFKVFDLPPYVPYLLNAIFVLFGACLNAISIRRYMREYPLREFFVEVMGVCLLVSALSLGGVLLVRGLIESEYLRLITVCVVSVVLNAAIVYWFVIGAQVRKQVNEKIVTIWSSLRS